MRQAAWADWTPPSYVPESSTVFFGANPIHTPALELTRKSFDDDPADDCPRCGGAYVAENGKVISIAEAAFGEPDPVRVYAAHVDHFGNAKADPLVVACGLCGRSSYDGKAAMSRAVKPEDGTIRDGDTYGVDPTATDTEHRTELAVVVSSAGQPGKKSKKERRRERVEKLGRTA